MTIVGFALTKARRFATRKTSIGQPWAKPGYDGNARQLAHIRFPRGLATRPEGGG